MKLQKQVSKTNGKDRFYKYVLIVPNKTIRELGWHGGDELVFNVTSKRLLLIGPKNKSDSAQATFILKQSNTNND